uniref:TBC1 domain family member 4 n=1 Tax=Ciona intestinalis TaxID=7719 RepID=UPI00089DAAF7|nr:TBC1 domain family member 4 [Ciona intestinalis]|eukprot:XP_018673312.1 TBC1 domain family member 4 [Ciona intestinalis]
MDLLLNVRASTPDRKTYYLSYMGELSIHRVYAKCMSQWLTSYMNYQNHPTPCAFTIDQSEFVVVHEEKPLIKLDDLPCNGHVNNMQSKNTSYTTPSCKSTNGFSVSDNLPLSCPLNNVVEIILPNDLNTLCVGFIVDNGLNYPLSCHTIRCEDYKESQDVAENMKKLQSWNQTYSGCHQSSKNVKLEDLDSIRFEVLLLGKIQVKQEYPAGNFIDEAVDKYHSLEAEHAAAVAEAKMIQSMLQQQGDESRNGTNRTGEALLSDVSSSIDGSRESAVEIMRKNNSAVWEDKQRKSIEEERQRCNSMDTASIAALKRRSKTRARHCSEPGTAATLGFDKNKTRLFQIGKQSVCLICPDQSARTVEIQFTDITRCAQGVKCKDHFGIFVKDQIHHQHHQHQIKEEFRFKCYLFKSSDSSVAEEIILAMKQACTMCSHGPDPLKTYHLLCKRINLASGGSAEQIIERGMTLAAKYIADLPDHDKKQIRLKIEEKTKQPDSKYDKLVVIMAVLRQTYEDKQSEHDVKVKQLREQASGNSVTQKFNVFRNRAKKSFSSFESLFEKGKQKMHELQHEAENHIASPVEKLKFFSDSNRSAPNTPISMSSNQFKVRHRSGSPSCSEISPLAGSSVSKNVSPKSNPLGTPDQSSLNVRRKLKLQEDADITLTPGEVKRSGQMGSTNSLRSLSSESTPVQSRSSSPTSMESLPPTATAERSLGSAKKMTFHQEIFHRITTPSKKKVPDTDATSIHRRPLTPLKTPDDVRYAWRRAIRDHIVLNRINKIAQTQLTDDQLDMKLNYVDVGIPQPEMDQVWLELLETEEREKYKMDVSVLHAAVRKGVSRNLRGRVWSLLHEQWKIRNVTSRATASTATLNRTHFSDLLKSLTPHHHSILIDIGRTFPNHPYFSQQLGKGQLGLFNLLKAYSLVDTEVGYCQGLSFVAGTILVHLNSTEKSFQMLTHLMKNMGCRNLYQPDMTAIRIAVYQLSRLLHDYHREINDHFEKHDVTLMLFAAPWFLTMFASILPFSFTARIFDLLFLEGRCALFKTALALLSHHKAAILEQDSFEAIIGYLKNKLPNMDAVEVNQVLQEIFTLDIVEKLRVYEVEYQVLDEGEIFNDEQPLDGEENLEQKVARLEQMNQTVTKYNLELVEQLEAAKMQISSLQQGLTDMAELDEKKAVELEALRTQNEFLKLKYSH